MAGKTDRAVSFRQAAGTRIPAGMAGGTGLCVHVVLRRCAIVALGAGIMGLICMQVVHHVTFQAGGGMPVRRHGCC